MELVSPWSGSGQFLAQCPQAVREAIVRGVYDGETSALNQGATEDDPCVRGQYHYLEVRKHLLRYLCGEPLGFRLRTFHNQTRLVPPEDIFGIPTRLLIGRGREEHEHLTVRRKGRLTRQLINVENAEWSAQPKLDLDFGPDEVEFDKDGKRTNIYIISDLNAARVLRVFLALPAPPFEAPWTTFTCAELLPLWEGLLGARPSMDLPGSKKTDFNIDERDGTGG